MLKCSLGQPLLVIYYTRSCTSYMNKLPIYTTINPRVHFCIWAIFITFEIVSVGTEYGQYGHPLVYLQNYALHITFFYLHALVIMPYWKLKNLNGYVRFVLLLISEYAGYICLNYQLNYGWLSFPNAMNEVKLDFGYRFILGRTWRLTYFLGMSTGYYFLTTYLKAYQYNLRLEREACENALREKEAEMALAGATNAALKAQINPHFFSNVLTFMYNRSRKSDPELGEAILLLSKMMRYAIRNEEGPGKILVESELSEVSNLISLWKLIKQDCFFVQLDQQAEAGKFRLIPLVLLTLAENMFKHGDLGNRHEPALFSVEVEQGNLFIHTSNLVYRQDSNQAERATGLENIRKRLIYEYGDDVFFEYLLVEDSRFNVDIKIDISLLE